MSVLEALGWAPFFAEQLGGPEDLALAPGRAVEDRGRRLRVRFEEGERLVHVPGRLRGAGEAPVVGDFVLATRDAEPTVVRVLARRAHLSRNVSGRTTGEQVLAANVDLVLVVEGLDAGPNPRRLERAVAAVLAGGAEPVVVLSKSDLAHDLPAALATAARAVPGARLLATSGRSGAGLDAIRALLAPGRTAVLVGQSGSGKSTLVNALLGEPVQRTGDVRRRDLRGRHTTSGRRLLLLPSGGALVDGPGIRELRLWVGLGVEGTFPDVAAIAAGCRFRDCRHVDEPQCAVREALLDGTLAPDRLESLRTLQREARAQAARRRGSERSGKERWRSVPREVRRMRKERER